jgi:ABC-type uncharacterized transport system substrate-binding protein
VLELRPLSQPVLERPLLARFLLAGLVGVLALAGGGVADAHPHVFITYSAAIIFDDRDIGGLRLTWTFDEMYSQMIQSDYTGAKSGAVTPDDVRTIEKEAFANLANYGYFLDVKINDEPVRVTKVKDFDVKFVDHRAVYQFTVPLETTKPRSPNVIEIGVFDREYYVEFSLKEKEAVMLRHAEGFATDCSELRNERRITVLGPIQRDLVVCTYARKS